MGERGLSIKTDGTKHAWESGGANEFPQLCEPCLGEDPYVRMMKEPFGRQCKTCDRPFTVFRWKPGKKARYKKTEICQTCAKIKNVCQTCVLDLQYHLPVQVRDAFLSEQERQNVPMSEANREYHAQQHNLMLEDEGIVSAYGKSSAPNQALLRMARVEPYYKRNRPHLCSFFARGECNRGETCPYLHEMPSAKGSALAKQNIKDRFHGRNDPVAEKMLATEGKPRQINRRRRGIPPPPPPPPSDVAEPSSIPPPPPTTS
ncbi:pre-mRNA-splicing factor RBM22/SLT11 [Achlya hypogyna]|uniref:Pre-mRNA-splicing factor RBM22/SLT11 n=1 Tax=Achlya hypogyna TaxID=1202772 RepID=A0A1V9ZNJ6_ACHHY|nr:pre-mRNA-splicing factor RBM22/SLT11 [Achlya hypogyna]